MRFGIFRFGSVRIGRITYDVVIDQGEIRKRRKKRSRKFLKAWQQYGNIKRRKPRKTERQGAGKYKANQQDRIQIQTLDLRLAT